MTASTGLRLQGRTAFVTAAGQGIGRAVAVAFLRKGAAGMATHLRAGLRQPLAAAPGWTVQALDVCDADAVQAAAAQHAGVNALFSAADVVYRGRVPDGTDDRWPQAFDLNVRSRCRRLRAFLPGMPALGGGGIAHPAVHLASDQARFTTGTAALVDGGWSL